LARLSTQARAIPASMNTTQFERTIMLTSRIAMILGGLVAVAVALFLGKAIMAPLALALVAGLMFGPVADQIDRRGVPPALSAGVVVLVFVALLSLAVFLFAAPMSEWVQRGPMIWDRLRGQLLGLRQPLETLGAIQDQLKTLTGNDAAMTVEVKDGGPVTDMALMAPSLLADGLLFLAGLYFFLATRHNLRISVLSLCYSRRTRWRAAHVLRDIELKVSKFLLSAAAINAGVGVCTTAALFALGVPTPWLWGALAAAMNFIPYIGQAVMFVVLFAVGLATESSMLAALLPVAAYAVINLTADQVIFPHLVGKALTLNPFIIFVATAFWIWIWGPIGGFVAVPSLLVLQSIILHVFPATATVPERARRREAQRDLTSAPTESSGRRIAVT